MNYLTQAGIAVALSGQRIRALSIDGLVPGAVKVGNGWIILAQFSITRNGSRGPQSSINGN